MEEKNIHLSTVLEALKTMFVSKEDLTCLLQQSMTSEVKLPKNTNNQKYTFTQKEIDKMPKAFKREFRAEGCTIRISRRQVSKNGFTYEIRYRRNGYNVYISDKNLERGKQRFIEKLKTAQKVEKNTKATPGSFHSFAMFYFENFRKRKVAPKTYESDLGRYKKYLLPYFGEKRLTQITSLECQGLIDELAATGKGKTTDEIYSLMSVIFKAAIAHGLLNKNPLDIVFHRKHEKTHGKALSKAEEDLLLSQTAGTEYQLMFAIALYTGMRPNEYETAKRDGDFIVSVNSKRKNGRIEYKKIPITPMLRPYIKDIQEFSFYKPYTLREKFNSILPNHILYDLRTTFYSRCTECGIPDVVQKLFVGHSLGELKTAYTDLSDDYLLKEGEKLKY